MGVDGSYGGREEVCWNWELSFVESFLGLEVVWVGGEYWV